MFNIAVVGIGRMGGRHADNLYRGRIRGARLACVCDIDKTTLEAFCKTHGGVRAYDDCAAMLADGGVDGAVIAVPHYFHGEIARKCMEADVHVLVEKPLTVCAEEARELCVLAQEKENLTCGVMLNQRTNPVYIRAKRLVDSGALGKLQRVAFTVTDWYRTQAYYDRGGWRASWGGEGGGTLINQCVHQLDLLQWITGMPRAVKAYCSTRSRNIGTENDVTAVLLYGGRETIFTASTHELPGENRLEIVGEKGALVSSPFKLTYYEGVVSEPQVNALSRSDYGDIRVKKRKKRVFHRPIAELLRTAVRGQQAEVLERFVAAANGERDALVADFQEGVDSVALINALITSGVTGRETALPADDEYAAVLEEKIAEESGVEDGADAVSGRDGRKTDAHVVKL